MDFGLNEDQLMLQKYAREFLEKECPSSLVRSMADGETAHDPAFYAKMAELGWMGIAIPETYGGQGMSYVDLGVLLEEMGRALVPGPFFASVCLAAPTILEAGTDVQRKELLEPIASGRLIATVAFGESSGRPEAETIGLSADTRDDSFVLSGTKRFVVDAHVADTIVVAVRMPNSSATEAAVTLFIVDADATGLSVRQLETMDRTRRWCEVQLDGVRVTPDAVLGEIGGGWPPLQRALRKTIALLSAECVGGAQRVLDLSVEYAKSRMQFGRPIGSFQAVKHKCADMLVDVEMARSSMYYAAWAASDQEAELPLAASIAKAYAGAAYSRVAAGGIQVHGGIGFTWEHDMHLYFKRAKSNELFLGDPAYHRELVARSIAA